MSTLTHRTLALALAAFLAAVSGGAQANRNGGHVGVGVGHHHHHHGHVGVGFGFGVGLWPYGYPYYGWAPGYVVVEQPPLVVERPMAPPVPAPTFAPKRGQDAMQMEADRRQCDREAMGQPAAMADASLFHRMVLVCMENRGYTVH